MFLARQQRTNWAFQHELQAEVAHKEHFGPRHQEFHSEERYHNTWRAKTPITYKFQQKEAQEYKKVSATYFITHNKMGNKQVRMRRGSGTDSFGERIPGPLPSKVRKVIDETGIAPVPSMLLQRLFISDRTTAMMEDSLVEAGITHILNLHGSAQYPTDKNIRYLHMPMSDGGKDSLMKFVPQVWEFIMDGVENGKLLIHCNLGQNRSVVMCAVFLMVHEGFDAETALEFIAARHHTININKRYLEQLRKNRDRLSIVTSSDSEEEHKDED